MRSTGTTAPPARLVLADGSVFHGLGFGAGGNAAHGERATSGAERAASGEVVFSTSMTGYQEALTDPSYAGQILVMTSPMIGNYGVNIEDVESAPPGRPQVAGFVVRELSRMRSNYRSNMELPAWLAEHGVLGIEGIDTRALVRRLRISGAINGLISVDPGQSDEELIEQVRALPGMSGRNLVGCGPSAVGSRLSALERKAKSEKPKGDSRKRTADSPLHVVALDCGAKQNIYRSLAELGCDITILPHDATAEQIRELKPDGLMVSNGPGDPAAVDATIATLRDVASEVPTFGICLGHQLLALSLGAKTYKLKFGHRGSNQPVRNLFTGAVEITSQNHGFAVDEASLRDAGCEVTHVNLNDGTVAGFRHPKRPIFSVQHHPEASPGPHDAGYLFDCFAQMMRSGQPLDADMVRFARRALGSRHSALGRQPTAESR